jgi:sterol desaturase/sphingolipid hydroxylase (fatty acid hydroxylase superfamily)
MFRHILKAHFVQLLPIQLLSFPLFLFFGFTTDYATLPSLSKFIAQFLIFNVIEDTGFYWVHRALHIPWLYKRVHARHHEFIKPYSLVGEIAHPVEFLFNFLLPMMIGPFLLGYLQGVHILTFWIWMVFRGARGADAHSGYYLPFHPLRLLSPIYGGALDHDIHHQLRGRKSNYGGYKFWDWICGTQFNPLTTKKQD